MSNIARQDVEATISRISESLSPAERAILEEAGDEVYDVSAASPDAVEKTPPAAPKDAAATEKADAPPAEAPVPAPAAEPPAPAAEAEPPAAPPPADNGYSALVTIKPEEVEKATASIDAAKAALAAAEQERKTLREKLDAGELAPSDYVAKLDDLQASRDQTRDELAAAQRLIERHGDQVAMQNQQMKRDWDNALLTFVGEPEHSIYASNKRMEQLFSQAVGEVGRELIEKKEDWTARQILAEAHKRLAADMPTLFAKPPAPAPAPAAKPEPETVKTPKVPVSIAAMPNAGAAAVTSKFGHLDGMTVGQLEQALARMSPADRAEYEALV